MKSENNTIWSTYFNQQAPTASVSIEFTILNARDEYLLKKIMSHFSSGSKPFVYIPRK